MINYTTNYKENLTLYWQQFYPDWEIPDGFHVHHIKPKCTFKDQTNPRIHHPRNLIALHVDDHAAIHRCRGDQLAACLIWSMKGRVVSPETKVKMSQAHSTRKRKPLSEEHKRKLSAKSKGVKRGPMSEETKEKMRQSAKNRPLPSDETKAKQSASLKGRIVSEETKEKLRCKRPTYKTPAKIKCPACGIMSNKKHINFCTKQLNT